jgi:aspartyl-tRNA(Asn)/glutamyl-tRNA(Gln) amidotransferase subunit C
VRVGPDEVRRIAALARLELDEEEVAALAGELSGILEHVDALVESRGSRVEGRDPGAPLGPRAERAEGVRLRPDEAGGDPLAAPPSAFAPAFEEGLFRVPGPVPHEPDDDGGGGRHPGRSAPSGADSSSISSSNSNSNSEGGS